MAISLIEHLGDIVACEPIARHVRARFPQATVVWCVREPYRELIDSNPHIDETLVIGCLTEWILLRKFHIFDAIVDLHVNHRVCAVCDIPLEKREGNPEVDGVNYYHFGGLLEALSKGAGIDAEDQQPRVYIPESVRERIDALGLPGRFVVFHCISNETCRDWPRAKWEELAQRIAEDFGATVVEVGHSALLRGFRHERFRDLCGALSILESAEVIRRATLFIGVDSGPAHLANAVGTRGIVLLGKYRAFERYLPYTGKYKDSACCEIIRSSGPVEEVDVKEVLRGADRVLAPSTKDDQNVR